MHTTDKAYEFLKRAIISGKVPNACLISGPNGSGCESVARRAAALLCTGTEDADGLARCPNYFEISMPAIKIEQVRLIQEELHKRAFLNDWRVILFLDAHYMTAAAQNALLKILEEPPEKTLFLFTGNESGLLQTILSRCQIIRLGLADWRQVAQTLTTECVAENDAGLCALISDGNLGRARELAHNPERMSLRNEALDLLIYALKTKSELVSAAKLGSMEREDWIMAVEFMLSFCRDLLCLNLGTESVKNTDRQAELRRLSQSFTTGQINCIINMLIETQERMSSNLSPASAMDRLFIKILEAINR